MSEPTERPPDGDHSRQPYPPEPTISGPPQGYGQPPPTWADPPFSAHMAADAPGTETHDPSDATAWESQAMYPPGSALQPYEQAAASWGGQQPKALVSVGGRFGGAVLEFLLIMVTLGVGWMIWTLFTWSTGQTPAKKLLGHVVVDAKTGERLPWERMCLREFVIRGIVLALGNMLTCGILALVDAFMVFGESRRTLHDLMAGSAVRYE